MFVDKAMSAESYAAMLAQWSLLPDWAIKYLPTVVFVAGAVWFVIERGLAAKEKVDEAEASAATETKAREAAERERDLFRAQAVPAVSESVKGQRLLERAKQLMGPLTPEFFWIGGYHAWLDDAALWYTDATDWVRGFAPESLSQFRDYPVRDMGALPYWCPPKDVSRQVFATWERLYTRACILHFILSGEETKPVQGGAASSSPPADSPP